MLKRTITGSGDDSILVVIFVFIWFGGLAVMMTSCAHARGKVHELLSRTPEYQCLKQVSGRDPYVSWSAVRYLRPNYSGTSFSGGTKLATIRERRGTNCIPEGDAITFVTLPATSGPERTLISFPGRNVKTIFRGKNKWIDFLSEDGLVHYRNDGLGYYAVRQ